MAAIVASRWRGRLPARVLALTTLSMVPALIFYVIAERQIVRGLTAGAVKG